MPTSVRTVKRRPFAAALYNPLAFAALASFPECLGDQLLFSLPYQILLRNSKMMTNAVVGHAIRRYENSQQ